MLVPHYEYTKATLKELEQYILEDKKKKADAAKECLSADKNPPGEPNKFRAVEITINVLGDTDALMAILQSSLSPIVQLRVRMRIPVEYAKDFNERVAHVLKTDTRLLSLEIRRDVVYKSYLEELKFVEALYLNKTLRSLYLDSFEIPQGKTFETSKREKLLGKDLHQPFLLGISITDLSNHHPHVGAYIGQVNNFFPVWVDSVSKTLRSTVNINDIKDALWQLTYFNTDSLCLDRDRQATIALKNHLSQIIRATELKDLFTSLKFSDTSGKHFFNQLITACKRISFPTDRVEFFSRKDVLNRNENNELDQIRQGVVSFLQAGMIGIFSEVAAAGFAIGHLRLGQYYESIQIELSAIKRREWIKENPDTWLHNQYCAAEHYLLGGKPTQGDLQIVCNRLLNAAIFAKGEPFKDCSELLSYTDLWKELEEKVQLDDDYYLTYIYTQILVELSLLKNDLTKDIEKFELAYAVLVKVTISLNALRNSSLEQHVPGLVNAINLLIENNAKAQSVDGPAKNLKSSDLPLLNSLYDDLSKNSANYHKLVAYWLRLSNPTNKNEAKIRDGLRLLNCFLNISNTSQFLYLAYYVENTLKDLYNLINSTTFTASQLVDPINLADTALAQNSSEQLLSDQKSKLVKNWGEVIIAMHPSQFARQTVNTESKVLESDSAYLERMKSLVMKLFVNDSKDQVKRLIRHGSFKPAAVSGSSETATSQGAVTSPTLGDRR